MTADGGISALTLMMSGWPLPSIQSNADERTKTDWLAFFTPALDHLVSALAGEIGPKLVERADDIHKERPLGGRQVDIPLQTDEINLVIVEVGTVFGAGALVVVASFVFQSRRGCSQRGL